MATAWDYIVIGAGHNGLIAGCRLAEAGASVLIVEKLPIPGGLTASHAYVAQAPRHLLSIGAMDDMYMGQTTLAADLGLPALGYERIALEAPYGWMNEDGDTLLLFADFARTVEEIRRHSRRDAQTYIELREAIDWICTQQDRFFSGPPADFGSWNTLKLVSRLVRDPVLRRRLTRWISGSAFEIIGETFESEAMRGLWAFWVSMVCPADVDGTGVFVAALGNVHRAGVHRPRGGMSSLIHCLQNKLESSGGEIRTGFTVERIVVEQGRATGVRLTSGEVLLARRGVLASCAPQLALGPMLDSRVLDRGVRERVASIPSNAANIAPFKIDMAIGGALSFPRAQARRAALDGFDVRKTTFMTGSLEDQRRHIRAIRLGQRIDSPPVYMAILTANDVSLAPQGEDVLYLHSNVPADLSNGDWADHKANYSQTIRASAHRFVSGLDQEIGSAEHSPAELEARFGVPRGCYFHVDMTASRLGMNRPAPGLGGYRTPVDRLYLAGAGTHPGGGVLGWPGRLAADCALSDRPA